MGLKKSRHFALWAKPWGRPGAETPCHIAISKRVVRLATERNRWRRRIREALRKHRDFFKGDRQIILSLQKVPEAFSYAEFEKEILGLLQQSGGVGKNKK